MNKFFLTTLLGLATLTASAQTQASPFELQVGDNSMTVASYGTAYTTYEATEDQFVTISNFPASTITVENGDNEVSSYCDYSNKKAYFPVPANTKLKISFYVYPAGTYDFTLSAQAQEYSTHQTPETAVIASENEFFVPFIRAAVYGQPAPRVYIKYTAPMSGKLTMHFSAPVSSLQIAEEGSEDYDSLDGSYVTGGWEATSEVVANKEYIISGTSSSGMMATFTTAEVVPGASCADAVKMKSGANELPAEVGSYWYSFTTPDSPAQTFVVLTTEADLTGGKAIISSSCSSSYNQIIQNGELHLRLPYNKNISRVLEIQKPTALAEASAVNLTFETPQLYDAFDTAQPIEADQNVTTPDFGGTYYYAVTAPETGNYFLDVTTETTVPSGTQVAIYASTDEDTVLARGTTSLRYNTEAGKKYVIKWECPTDLRSLPFTAKFTEIQQGETASDPIIAVIGENTVPAMSDVFFSYTADADSWLIVTPAAGMPIPSTTAPEERPSYLTIYDEDGGYRFQATQGIRYQIEFTNVAEAGSFTLTKREYSVGETAEDPIIAVDGEATIPNAGGTYWVKYTATEDGFADVTTNATYTTSNTLGIYVGDVANNNYTRMLSNSNNGYETLSFAVKTGDVLYIKAAISAPEADMKFTFTQREAGPGETVGTAIVIPFTENPTTFEFDKTVSYGDDPIWYSIDLTEGLFTLEGTASASMYLYAADNTETSIGSYGYSSGKYIMSNVSIPAAGTYYLKLTTAYSTFTATISERQPGPGETATTAIEIKPTENPYEAQLTVAENSSQSIWYSIILQPGDFNYSTTVYGSANAALYKASNLNGSIATSSMDYDTWGQKLETSITEGGKYYLKITNVTREMKATLSGTAIVVDTTVGVEEIEAEAQDAVYYNMEGVRVDNPEKGIYIRVIGNRRDKVVIR